jgi:hypothetical protein
MVRWGELAQAVFLNLPLEFVLVFFEILGVKASC